MLKIANIDLTAGQRYLEKVVQIQVWLPKKQECVILGLIFVNIARQGRAPDNAR